MDFLVNLKNFLRLTLGLANQAAAIHIQYFMDGSHGYIRWHCLIYAELMYIPIYLGEIIVLVMAIDRFCAIWFPVAYFMRINSLAYVDFFKDFL